METQDFTTTQEVPTQPSAGKLMAAVLWDCKGILLIDYMAHKTTITGEVYATQLAMLKDAIKEKR